MILSASIAAASPLSVHAAASETGHGHLCDQRKSDVPDEYGPVTL